MASVHRHPWLPLTCIHKNIVRARCQLHRSAPPPNKLPCRTPLAELFQGVSLLETLHAAVGLVPSSPAMALMQWAGRSNVLFLVLDAIPQVGGR